MRMDRWNRLQGAWIVKSMVPVKDGLSWRMDCGHGTHQPC